MQPAAASPLELTVRVVGKKWKPTILRLLAQTSRRFNQLHASIPGIAHKVLIEQLRELEQDGVVRREVKVGGYRRVQYSLTESGRELLPILERMESWGQEQQRLLRERAGRRLDHVRQSSEPYSA